MSPSHGFVSVAALVAMAPLSSGLSLPQLPGGPGGSAQGPAGSQPVEVATSEAGSVRFAVIGDYGAGLFDPEDAEGKVADLVHQLAPDLIITTGDNNYPYGEYATIDYNIGKYYADYIAPYTGSYGPGSDVNRFFPALGNHDWYWPATLEGQTVGGTLPEPHLDYFTLPGNERYYEFKSGPVHFFCVDSDVSEPDGNTKKSTQARWIKGRLAASTSPFQIVYLHHPPYSSGPHGSSLATQWPWQAWGADAVLAGHEHLYERLFADGVAYFTVGTSGSPTLYTFVGPPIPQSQVRYSLGHGAMIVDATATTMRFRFLGIEGSIHDDYTLLAGVGPTPNQRVLVQSGADWRFWDQGTCPDRHWTAVGYPDAAWNSGPGQLGYGDGDEATTIDYGGDPLMKHAVTYFRRTIDIAEPSKYRRLVLRTLRDDGIRVFLNGAEVYRVNLPLGPLPADAMAVLPVVGAEELDWIETHIDPSHLKPGANVLAVSVHQVHPTSSDLSFNLELLGAW